MLRQGVFRMITVRECQYDEVKKFRELEGEYHYMGESHGAGDMIRLIFEEDGKWIRTTEGVSQQIYSLPSLTA